MTVRTDFLLQMESGILATKNYQDFNILGTDIKFVGAKNVDRAFPGDKVVWVPEKGIAIFVERAKHILVGTLELNSNTRYGMTSRGVPLFLFKPYNESYPPFYVGSAEKDLTRPQLAVVAFENWELGSACPRGVLARALLGPAGDIVVEKQALLLHYAGTASRPKIPDILLPALEPTLLAYTVSIDPDGCRDIDDAISMWKENDKWNIAITIADVASMVLENPALFNVALARGQTFYDCGRVVAPMLPPQISENVCSLLEGQARRGLTLFMKYCPVTGNVENGSIESTVVRVARNHTYESVMSDMQFPGNILTAAFRCAHDSHEWVEHAMIHYNVQFAKKMCNPENPGILRRHSRPDAERLEKIRSTTDLSFLAYSSAEYCSALDPHTKHWGLEEEIYCHASSPIRRFSDLFNQLVWKGQRRSADIPLLNRQQKEAKHFDRDCFFVTQLLSASGPVDAIVFESNEKQSRLWFPTWKQLIKYHKPLQIGTQYKVHFHMDATKRSWKRRIVLKLEE
jgi:exoribonuclease R